MATIEFTAYPRTTEGRGASRRMRRAGKAPGIVYGGAEVPAPIELDHNALVHALKNEAFHASILSMKLNGATQKVLLRDVQMHPFRPQVLHVDFQRVDENKKIHMKVPLHFVNGEISPAVKTGGAIISHVATEVDIVCLPRDLPEFVEVDLSALEANHSIRVSGLKLPPGVTAVRHGTLDPVVATAIIPKAPVEVEEEEAAAAAAAVPAGEVPTTAQAVPEAAEAPADKKEKGGKDRDDKKK